MFDAHQGRRFVHKIGKSFKPIGIIAVLNLVKAFFVPLRR
jgi:hypothetical protein